MKNGRLEFLWETEHVRIAGARQATATEESAAWGHLRALLGERADAKPRDVWEMLARRGECCGQIRSLEERIDIAMVLPPEMIDPAREAILIYITGDETLVMPLSGVREHLVWDLWRLSADELIIVDCGGSWAVLVTESGSVIRAVRV